MDLDSCNAALPVKQAARRLLAACREFDKGEPGTLMKLYREAAAVEAHLSGKACSWKKIQTKYREWVNAGRDDWALLDKRYVFSNSHKARTNNPEFKTFLYNLVTRNNRSTEQALHDLREIWAAHGLIGIIPGYEDWPGWPDIPIWPRFWLLAPDAILHSSFCGMTYGWTVMCFATAKSTAPCSSDASTS